MKITKVVTIDEDIEVDVHVDADDICLILSEGDNIKDVKRELNRIAQYLKGIPEKIIDEFTQENRKMIKEWFVDISKRFEDK